MAISRTWYNTLVDDSGSNTDGSVWDKADVDSLLDAVDALVTDPSSVTYSAGNFTSDAGTWTVSSTDQVSYRYNMVNGMMVLHIVLTNTTVSGSPTALRVAIPGGFTAAIEVDGSYGYKDNGTRSTGLWQATAGATYVGFFLQSYGSAWAASTDATDIRATVIIPTS